MNAALAQTIVIPARDVSPGAQQVQAPETDVERNLDQNHARKDTVALHLGKMRTALRENLRLKT